MALLLARVSLGAPAADAHEAYLLLGLLMAEVLEDLVSLSLVRAEVNVSPPVRLLTSQEIQEISQRRLRRSSRSSISPVLPDAHGNALTSWLGAQESIDRDLVD